MTLPATSVAPSSAASFDGAAAIGTREEQLQRAIARSYSLELMTKVVFELTWLVAAMAAAFFAFAAVAYRAPLDLLLALVPLAIAALARAPCVMLKTRRLRMAKELAALRART